jgi:hypothetical protein
MHCKRLSLSNFPLSFSRITKPRLSGVDRKRDMVLLGIFKARANSVSATGVSVRIDWTSLQRASSMMDSCSPLRHQLIVLRRNVPDRARLTNKDRWFFIQLYRWFPSILQLVTVVQSETLVRWHRAGFRLYWRWKSGLRGGRPQIETDLRALIGR